MNTIELIFEVKLSPKAWGSPWYWYGSDAIFRKRLMLFCGFFYVIITAY